MIYIFDILGMYCGMHYYDKAFVELLKSHGCQSVVLSNYEEEGVARRFFPVFFQNGKLSGILRFACTYLKFPFFLLSHRNNKIVYLTYGEVYELPFLISLILVKKAYVDVHEVHALKYKDDSKTSKLFEWIYRHVIKKVIYHSDRTKRTLGQNHLKMLYVPHFKYVFKKTYDENLLGNDVKDVFLSRGVKRFLFFGNLSVVKGGDTVVDVFNNIKTEEIFELVIAGKNVDHIDFSSVRSDKVRVIERHINDDELVYLYSHTDYVLLPYKKSSQSGIFAMSAYFRKPMILSDIPYFRTMINEYPSFGIVCPMEQYQECVLSIIEGGMESPFTAEDCAKFEMKEQYEAFIREFNKD